MDTALEAFLADADKLPGTLRYQRLHTLSRYFRGTQYQARELDVGGYRKRTPGVYGSASRTPAWSERDPGAVYNVVGEAVETLTEWTLSGEAWCHLEIADDDEAEEWIGKVATLSNLPTTLAAARNMGGATGTAVVSFAIVEGEVFLEVHGPEHCWPLAWRDERRHRPAAVAKVYRGDNPLAKDEGDYPLVCRYWDEKIEATYRRVKDPVTLTWRWEETAPPVSHGLGFCPVYWLPQRARDGSHDGVPDGDEDHALVDEVNELYAAGGATTKRNADDTLVVKEDPALNPGQVRKGGYNTIFARGGAEYLSQDGASATICMEVGKTRAEQMFRRRGVVLLDRDTMGKTLSGEALKRIFQRVVNTAGDLRGIYARGLIVPLCQGLLNAGRILRGRRQALKIPPRVVVDEALGTKVISERTPGRSSFVECLWPPAFPPTADDVQKLVTTIASATGGKQILSQKTAVAMLKTLPIPITSVEEELDQIAADQDAAAALGAKALGLAPDEPGSAGPVPEKAGPEAEEDPEEAANDAGKQAAE
jgi:hypothetical protein